MGSEAWTRLPRVSEAANVSLDIALDGQHLITLLFVTTAA